MKILIIGGAGFIGCNTAKHFLDRGDDVIVFDNLSRRGAALNLEWLQDMGSSFTFIKGDIREYSHLKKTFQDHPDIDVCFHLAAQVAVTTSLTDPRLDFEINALGTFNVIEVIREHRDSQKNTNKPILLYSSTNKVYGRMEDIEVVERNGRYEYKNLPNGISEERPLDFHSPYGCSKGSADQYVHDYGRIYDIPVVIFRKSCIYGPRQFGVEDQGWVAWFTIASVLEKPITIYGDGKQVRDVLFIDDLIDCYLMALQKLDATKGKIYNIGGGPKNKISLLDLVAYLEKLSGKKLTLNFADRRLGDQRVFVCDVKKAKRDFGWKPSVGVEEGVYRLFKWISANQGLFSD